MGMFDALAGQVAGALGEQLGGQAKLVQAVLSLINSPQVGGLQGLIAAFQREGLGEIVQSWLSQGANLPVSASQLGNVLGSAAVASAAQEAGMQAPALLGQLTQLLPTLMDQLSPDGALPQGDAMAQVGSLLGGLLK